jgi:TPP-dependent trihydroxycyclohexane-1,2-dione (THcHDO) dehydratase
MSKLALTLFNMVEETMIVLGPFENVQVTYGTIRPFVGDRYTDMELVPNRNNFYKYKDKKYSDFRIEAFDADKHKGIEMIGEDTKYNKEDLREAFNVARHIGKKNIAYEFDEWFNKHKK